MYEKRSISDLRQLSIDSFFGIDMLRECSVSEKPIIENPFLLVMDKAIHFTMQVIYLLVAKYYFIARKEKKDKQKAYISSRLSWTEEEAAEASQKWSARRISFAKAEKLLDFILKETHFTKAHVLKCVRVFRWKVDEIRARYHELISIGVKPKRVTMLLFSRNGYIKYARRHCKTVWNQFLAIEKRVKEQNIPQGALEKHTSR